MVARGESGQWGDRPLAERPPKVERAEEWYEEQGFTKTETFAVAEWRGQVFERRAG